MNTSKTIMLFVAVLSITAACHRDFNADNEDATDRAARPVIVQEVKPANDPIPVVASGVLGSKAEVTLSFKIGGIVQHIHVEEGQSFRKGQLLAQLNMVEISARASQARQALEKAARDLQRAANLYEDSVITLEQLQDLRTVHELAAADLQIAEFNRDYARIVASENGTVLKRFAEEGELVGSGTPVLQVGNTSGNAFVLRLGLADVDIVRLRYADSAMVRFDAYPHDAFGAHVTEIAQSADPSTGTFEVELSVVAGNRSLKNGFVGRASIYPGTVAPYYRISTDALVGGSEQSVGIFVVEPASNKARRIPVNPAHIGNDYFTVLTSEFQGGTVITEGAAYLSDGQDIRIVN